MTDIVQQSSISYPTIKQDLVNYVRSLDDYSTKWVDFYEGGAGTTILELIAGMGTYLNLVALKSRREAYIDEAKLFSSTVGIATTIGYDINRPTATEYSLDIFVTNPITQQKEVPIGSYNNLSLSLLQDTYFSVGENPNTLVAIGDWKNYTITSTSSASYSRIYIEGTVDNNLYELTINDQPVSIVRAAELLDETNVLSRTYFTGTYIIFGDGIFGKSINVGDVISYSYFSPGPIVLDQSINLTKLRSNVGTVLSGDIITYGSSQDSQKKIAVVAPGYYTAKRRLVTLSDYQYLSLSYNGIISSSVQKHPNICCTADLAVIADGGRSLIANEQTSLLAYLDQFKVLGTTINLVNPVSISTSVYLLILIVPNADQSAIQTTITNYLNTMTYQLGGLFSMNGLLNLNLPGVSRIYPKYPIIDHQAAYNQYFKLTSVNFQFTNNLTTAQVNGIDPSVGYVVNDSNI